MKKTLCLLSALTAAALALAGCEKKAVDETSSASPVNETTSPADTAGGYKRRAWPARSHQKKAPRLKTSLL